MKYNQCQKDIIYYIIRYSENPVGKLIPCADVFGHIFQEKYTNLEIEENVGALVFSGVLKPYGFHSYLNLTETFKTSHDYKLFRDKKI